jgi:hypothetical protein
MSDNKEKRDAQDRSRVSGNEDYEIRYLSEKFGVDTAIVHKAISEVGNQREAIEEFLNAYKKGEPF